MPVPHATIKQPAKLALRLKDIVACVTQDSRVKIAKLVRGSCQLKLKPFQFSHHIRVAMLGFPNKEIPPLGNEISSGVKT